MELPLRVPPLVKSRASIVVQRIWRVLPWKLRFFIQLVGLVFLLFDFSSFYWIKFEWFFVSDVALDPCVGARQW
jgi:hypothetical protein